MKGSLLEVISTVFTGIQITECILKLVGIILPNTPEYKGLNQQNWIEIFKNEKKKNFLIVHKFTFYAPKVYQRIS